LDAPSGQAAWEFPAAPEQVAVARRETTRTLAAWGLPGAVDTAVLVVSELVTNAVLHAPAGQVSLVLTHGDGVLLVEVRDECARPPALVREGEGDEGGRGLQLVHGLSSHWGWCSLGHDLKCVWALLAVRGADG
jgi:anti-sigma regulatory factor (Ser/Thr protein kinase)